MFGEQRQAGAFSYGPFVWWMGMVVDRMDPMKLGRVRVRIHGYHTPNEKDIPNKDVFWAVLMTPGISASISGVGNSPTGLVEGSTVIGFFADGHEAQHPIILGSLPGKPDKGDGGFKDPNGKYPRSPGEEDTNRLSRNEKISETVVEKKRSNLDKSEIAQFGDGKRPEWEEKETEYNAKYPFNHTYESESGHIQEFDDTEGKERYHLYHRKGTFKEISPDGTTVEKIVKDNYSITLGDDYCHIKGDCKITVDGEAKILVKGDATVETASDFYHKVGGNYNLKIGGNYTIKVGGTEKHTASLILLN